MAGEWGLDSDFAKVMAHHHRELQGGNPPPVSGEYSLTGIIEIADNLAKCLEEKEGRPHFNPAAGRFVQRYLSGLEDLLKRSLALFKACNSFLESSADENGSSRSLVL